MDKLIKEMDEAFQDYYVAGERWSKASERVILAAVLHSYPAATLVEVTVVLDPGWTEHSVRVFKDSELLGTDEDFLEDSDYDNWFMAASEGVVFGEGDSVRITVPKEEI